MYIPIAVIAILCFFFILSQFGARLTARHSLIWWIIFIFVIIATLYPSSLNHIASLLGVQIVSNLVFGGLILLLMFLVIELTADLTKTNRMIREIITNNACERFILRVNQQSAMLQEKSPDRAALL